MTHGSLSFNQEYYRENYNKFLIKKGETMKKFLFISLLAISVLSQANTQTIGVGAYQKNAVYHSKNQVNMLPIINLEYNNFYNI